MSSEPARLPDSTRALHTPIGASRGDNLGELRTTAVRDRDSVGVGPVNTPSSHADSFTHRNSPLGEGFGRFTHASSTNWTARCRLCTARRCRNARC